MAKLLGYAGALPFGVCALAGVLDIQHAGLQTASLLLGYGAIILSFLGGLQWGRIAACDEAAQSPSAPVWLIWSVIPSLVGWAGLFLPSGLAAIVLSACFLVALIVDLKLIRAGVWAAWMYDLRLHLTAIAIASLLSSLFWV